jgi:hypothetical protein
MQLIDSVSWSASSYTDIAAPPGTVLYQLEFRKGSPCVAARVTSNYYMSALSNFSTVQVTGINEPEGANDVVVYPNPLIDFTTVDVSRLKEQNLSVKIISLTGQIISEMKIEHQTKFTISKGNLSKGIYLLEIRTNSVVIRKKLLVE